MLSRRLRSLRVTLLAQEEAQDFQEDYADAINIQLDNDQQGCAC